MMPMKKILKIIINSILGAGAIYVINAIGTYSNFHIGLNWWTIVFTGFFGIPGVIAMIFIKLLVVQ